MNNSNLNISNSVIAFMFSCLIFGFLAAGIATAQTATSSGSFVKKDYSINGDWSIEQRGDQHVIKFNGDFKTKKGPDLKIFLSPLDIKSVRGSNATDGSVMVAVLKSHKGAQEYVLPDNVDLADYASLLIHCEKFSVLWGGTNI